MIIYLIPIRLSHRLKRERRNEHVQLLHEYHELFKQQFIIQ